MFIANLLTDAWKIHLKRSLNFAELTMVWTEMNIPSLVLTGNVVTWVTVSETYCLFEASLNHQQL